MLSIHKHLCNNNIAVEKQLDHDDDFHLFFTIFLSKYKYMFFFTAD